MDDLIRRSDAIRIASGYCHFSNVAKELAKLPSAQPESQWIPCSERLPERPEQMLVYAINTHFSIAKYKEVRKGVNDYIYTWVTDNAFDVPHEVKNVIAWMPLPEPYKAERREDG